MATCGQLKCYYMGICSFLKIIGLQTVQTLIWPYSFRLGSVFPASMDLENIITLVFRDLV